MRISRTHRVISAAVMTTIATATVVTFAQGDVVPKVSVSALPNPFGDDAPSVGASDPESRDVTAASDEESASDDPSTEAEEATKEVKDPQDPQDPKSTKGSKGGATKPGSGTGVQPAPTSAPPTTAPTPAPPPAPSPTPTPKPKNLLEMLLGQ